VTERHRPSVAKPGRVERYRPQQATADLLPIVQWVPVQDTPPAPIRGSTRELLTKLVEIIKRART
jgi:hypothetical protein